MNVDTERVIGVPNQTYPNTNIKTTNFGALALNGRTAYCIKVDGENKAAMLSVFSDFEDESTRVDYPIDKDKAPVYHANGLAYYNNYLYVNTAHRLIRKIGKKGIAYDYYNVDSDTSLITKYKGNEFIIDYSSQSFAINGVKHMLYRVGTLSDHKFKETSRFYVKHSQYDDLYTSNQDFYYDPGKNYLFIPFSKRNRTPGSPYFDWVYQNLIHVVNLGGSYTMYGNTKVYNPINTLYINKDPKYFKTYEVESIAFGPKNYILFSTNLKRIPDDPKKRDSIQRILSPHY